MTGSKPRIGVFKLASCDGCQLTLLDCEDELLAVLGAVDLVRFAEATSRQDDDGPLDLVLVEGSVTTDAQREELLRLRARAVKLVAIGACATAGGIQSLRNWADHEAWMKVVYAKPEYVSSLAVVTPASAHVTVDFELRGCPISKHQLLELITALLVGRRPQITPESVCMECKRAGNVCVLVAKGAPCLGPVTHAGCAALCPSYNRGCFGCYGPKELANPAALAARLAADGLSEPDLVRAFRSFTAAAPAFAREGDAHDD